MASSPPLPLFVHDAKLEDPLRLDIRAPTAIMFAIVSWDLFAGLTAQAGRMPPMLLVEYVKLHKALRSVWEGLEDQGGPAGHDANDIIRFWIS